MSLVRIWHRQLMPSRDHFSKYLKQHKGLFFCKLLHSSSCGKHNKRIKVQLVLKSLTFHYAELLQFLLREDLVNNGYSLFAEEVISEPQYAEEFIKSFQFNLVTTLSRF